MYKKPSARRKKNQLTRLNLTPILDAVFIFIFFLITSISFLTISEIPSDVPLATTKEPPKKDKPLALTVRIEEKSFQLFKGVPSSLIKTIPRKEDGLFDYELLHTVLIDLKKAHMKEDTLIIEPTSGVIYEEIIQVMDAARVLRNTDEGLYKKDENGLDVKLETLFGNIVFGNILS